MSASPIEVSGVSVPVLRLSVVKPPLPQTEFVDREGDVWQATGHDSRGELVLACPEPQDPCDAGEGVSRAWTLREVQSAFGPLIARSAVAR